MSRLRSNLLKTLKLAAVTIPLLLALTSTANVYGQDATGDESQNAIKLFNEGQDAHEKGDVRAAIELYKKALVVLPEFAEAELQKGNAQLSLNQTEEAERSFRRAVELRPEWTLALSSLGSALVTEQKYQEARPVLEKAILLDEQSFPALAAYAELVIRTKASPELTRSLLEKLTSLTSKAKPPADIWSARGAIEKALGDSKAARSSFLRAREIDPNNKNAIVGLADIALSENDLDSARQLSVFYKKLTSDSDQSKLLEARVLAADGKPDDALAVLDSIKKISGDVTAFRSGINTARSTDIPALTKELETSPSNVQVLAKLCMLERVSDPSAALDHCRRASELEPQNVKHAVGYGAALVQARQFTEAAALLRSLLRFAPDNVTIHANLATSLFEMKRYEEAKPEFQWLVEKQPERPIPYYFLAITHDQLQEYMDAMANYQSFLKLADPQEQKLEIDKVNLRLPTLAKLIKDKKGKRK
jgi:protein O-GlcNAc transferase